MKAKNNALKINNRLLLLIASIVWLIAGFSVTRIGVIAYKDNLSIVNVLFSVLIFCIFWFAIFKNLVTKHTIRIKGYFTEKQYFWNFFDFKSFIIMVFMMTLGISLRAFNLAPTNFIAILYVGIGTALVLASFNFGLNYLNFSNFKKKDHLNNK